MIWLTWRQFRTQAITVYAAGIALAVILAMTGPQLVGLFHSDAASADDITRLQSFLYAGGAVVVFITPALIGVFWGAPLVARELEAGTHRLVWNQTVTRTHWLATKLGVMGLAAIAAAGLLSLAVSWWSSPIDRFAAQSEDSGFPARIAPLLFDARGIAPIGYAAFAFILGVTAGVLIRRTVPAMAVTLAVFTAVQVVVPLWVRPHLAAPVQQTVTVTRENLRQFGWGPGGVLRLEVATPLGAWVHANQTVDADGRALESAPPGAEDCVMPSRPALERDPDETAGKCLASLAELGYQQQVVYHPGSRFWALQWAETGIFLVLSLLLAAVCFRWTRHRLS